MGYAKRGSTGSALDSHRRLAGFVFRREAGHDVAFEESWFSQSGPGGEPPWYFIGHSVRDALASVAAILPMLVIAFACVGRLGPSRWAMLGIACLSVAADIGAGVNILIHTRNIWRADLAWSAWTTFEEYSASEMMAYLVSIVIGTAVAIALVRKSGRPPRLPATLGEWLDFRVGQSVKTWIRRPRCSTFSWLLRWAIGGASGRASKITRVPSDSPRRSR